jgi:hypothetical protein
MNFKDLQSPVIKVRPNVELQTPINGVYKYGYICM